MKKIVINIFKIAFSLAVFLLIFNFVSKLLIKDNDAFKRRDSLNSLPQNSIDIMFIGNSHSYTTFNPLIISEVTGKTSYNAAMPSQVLDLVWYNFELLLKNQSPRVVVLETFAFQDPSARDVFNDSNIDSMPYGVVKLSAIFDIFSKPKDRFQLLSSIYRHHGNWSDGELINDNLKSMINGKNFSYIESEGFYELDSRMTADTVYKLNNLKPSEYVYKAKVTDYNKKYFEMIYSKCKEKGIKLVAVMAPMNKNFVDKTNYNNVHSDFEALFKSKGIDFIDYNLLYKEINLRDEDFANEANSSHHVNVYGAAKVSEHFGHYLSSITNGL